MSFQCGSPDADRLAHGTQRWLPLFCGSHPKAALVSTTGSPIAPVALDEGRGNELAVVTR